MSRPAIGTMEPDDAIHLLTRQRNRNRILAIGTLVLIAVSFGIATSLMYLTP